MAIRETYDVTPDNLMGGPEFPVLTKNYAITAGTALKRGTLLTITDGKAAATAKAGVASAIVANDASATDTVVTAYVAGRFNRDAIIVADGADSAAAHEEELRKVGIHLA